MRAPDQSSKLAERAKSLLSQALASFDAQHGFSTASCQIYDTAWLSMIAKTSPDGKTWLFPECFHHIMREQATNGSWGASDTSQTSRILDTAAALLALQKHAAEPMNIIDYSTDEMQERIKSACRSLQVQLTAWTDLQETNHIGVELIVPALLDYLEEQDSSLQFSFPTQEVLQEMRTAKLSHFRPETLYETHSSPAVYSLEAFVGKIDFGQISHQLFNNGSMWTSPASTAAYLIYSTQWDDEAEAYLKHVIREGQGHGTGAVPGTFPTHYFELNWVVATLLQADFTVSDLGADLMEAISSIVRRGFLAHGGLLGHAPGAIDADDTAKGLLALRLLGTDVGVTPDSLIKTFERKDGFSTFGSERDRSLSTNCHVLRALLAWDNFAEYGPAIHKATTFIVNYWWQYVGSCKDKWHQSPCYPRMLMVDGLTTLLRCLEKERSQHFLSSNILTKVSIILAQIVTRTILDQCDDGSWGHSAEETAFGILTLGEARHLCFFHDLRHRLQGSIDEASMYLKSLGHSHTIRRHWTSKTQYQVKQVASAYVLAAMHVSQSIVEPGVVGSTLGLPRSCASLQSFATLLRRTRHFADTLDWLTLATMTESMLWLPLLQDRRLEIFPRDDQRISKDRYFNLLPALWVGCMYRSRNFVPNVFIEDMVFMTLLNIQIDEFMEGVVTPALQNDPSTLHLLVDEIVNAARDGAVVTNGLSPDEWQHRKESGGSGDGEKTAFHVPETVSEQVRRPLERFTFHVLAENPAASASTNDHSSLEQEFRAFLHSQTTQIEHNAALNHQREDMNRSARQRLRGAAEDASFGTTKQHVQHAPSIDFFQWVRTIASDHVSTPFTWAWVCCWISANVGQGSEVFREPSEKYFAAATARHLATANRMFNDLGSLQRDLDEGNLNSVHFSEFTNARQNDVASRKAALKSLANYEHECVQFSRRRLEAEVHRLYPDARESSLALQKLYILGLLCDVASLWDQLYALRDLSSRIHTEGPNLVATSETT